MFAVNELKPRLSKVTFPVLVKNFDVELMKRELIPALGAKFKIGVMVHHRRHAFYGCTQAGVSKMNKYAPPQDTVESYTAPAQPA